MHGILSTGGAHATATNLGTQSGYCQRIDQSYLSAKQTFESRPLKEEKFLALSSIGVRSADAHLAGV